ncbi:copper-binding protein [Leptothrix discophora]|uniref:Copper-binding protein n=1 Tax=Leptothrix discophora TaxID=89 RepID=A0ABT9G2E2_LEPDI|nr:copper-binding protein [Leptothrix discophora]MDP4300654.1 copper-binding protein [Leptothrix discophora]
MNTTNSRRLALLGMLAALSLSTLSTAGAAEPADGLSEAEIRRVDKAGGKLTLKHGELRNLDMPPMTMVFVVRDPKGIEGLKVGDRIRFVAGQDGPNYTVQSWELVK